VDADALGYARERVQHALSHARLAHNPDIRKQWQELADAWLAILTEMERQPKPAAKPQVVTPSTRGR
jgi:hypothetical protein